MDRTRTRSTSFGATSMKRADRRDLLEPFRYQQNLYGREIDEFLPLDFIVIGNSASEDWRGNPSSSEKWHEGIGRTTSRPSTSHHCIVTRRPPLDSDEVQAGGNRLPALETTLDDYALVAPFHGNLLACSRVLTVPRRTRNGPAGCCAAGSRRGRSRACE